MRILITGAGGMLGSDVCRAATDAGLQAVALDHGALDVSDPDAVAKAIGDARPDAVVNCAAWTDVDGAESRAEDALAANRDGAANLARTAAAAGAWTVQVSTDYVFDGTKSSPYLESDEVNPVSAYGRSKLEGELAVADAAPDSHTIVRSAWLFGNTGHCFPKTILRLASERDELTVVDDQVGCPTFTGHLARALIELATARRLDGVVHVAAGGQCSWFDFAREIVVAARASAEVKPGTTADLARPATRPAYSVLRSERSGAPALPDWREGLEEFMAARVGIS
jgi:dTDP-4-dehydrorhamnose reductase